jgi:hypothetical protein
MQKLILFVVVFVPLLTLSQSHNHWTRSFNEESSLLSGAVVGGGAGPSAIYYNPASIAEITESKFSLHASLFSFNFLNVKNALGDGVDLDYTRGIIEPRFLSYMVKPKKHPEWSLEIAFLNNENYRMDITQSVDQNLNILTNIPGEERYYAYFQYRNIYRDDWIGFGGSWKVSPSFFVGSSMFVSIKTLEYNYTIDIEAYPLDSVFINDEYVPFFSANYLESEYVKFNDYRLLWKFGLLYKKERFSVGFNITTPSLGGIYSDGKKVMHKEKQSNISLPETGEPLPNYVLTDYKEKKDVFVNSKSSLSVAAGLTYYIPDGTKILYTTVEYFAGIDPYRMVQAGENPDLASGSVFEDINVSEWLTFVSGAKPILNAAIGYRWTVKKDLMMMAGFRTDFNYRKNYDYNPYAQNKTLKGLDLDIYHFTGGLSWRIKGQDLITGLQYTVGREKNQQQFMNLSDPVEFNTTEMEPLQGTRQNTMKTFFNSLSLYFGATFNFGGGNNK